MSYDAIERRRHPRVPLGIPVRVQLDGDERPQTVELVDVSFGGGSFRLPVQRAGLGQRAAFGFIMPDRSLCVARGRIVRVDRHGFAVAFDRMNAAFRTFLGDVSGPAVCAA